MLVWCRISLRSLPAPAMGFLGSRRPETPLQRLLRPVTEHHNPPLRTPFLCNQAQALPAGIVLSILASITALARARAALAS
jgi:xanthine/CO dehydrogenase XdhC/CoxF family maturation factor